MLGDALMASHDVNVAVSSGAATPLERQTVRWIGEFVGFAPAADGLMAAGGTISNLTALTAARERALPGVRHEGLDRAPARAVLLRRGALLGAPRRRGARHRRAQRARDRDRRQPAHGSRSACADAIDADRRAGVVPVAVVATAGTTLTGAVDDLGALADVCAAARGVAARRRRLRPAGRRDRARRPPLRRARPRRLGDRRRAQVAVRAEGLQRAAGPRPRRPRGRLHPRRELHPPHRPRGRPPGRPHARVLASAQRAEAVAGLPRPRRAARSAPRSSATCARRACSPSWSREDPRLELLVEPQLSAVCFRHLPPEHMPALASQRRARRARSTPRGGSCSPRRPSTACRACAPASSTTAPARTTSARSSTSCSSSARALARRASGRGRPARRSGYSLAAPTPAPRHHSSNSSQAWRRASGARRSLSARSSAGLDAELRQLGPPSATTSAITSAVTSGWNCTPRWRPWRNAGRADLAAGQLARPGRHAQLLVVPVKPRPGRDPVGAPDSSNQPICGAARGHHLAAERDRQRLAAEAQPEHRHVGGDRLAQQRDLARRPTERLGVGGRRSEPERGDEGAAPERRAPAPW